MPAVGRHPIGTQPTRTTSVTRRRQPFAQPLQVSLLADISSAFTYSLTHYQLATESATAALLAGVGDGMAQLSVIQQENNSHNDGNVMQENAKHNLDWRRTRIFVLKGSVSGILWSKWYAFCDPFSMDIAQQCYNNLVQLHQHLPFAVLNPISDDTTLLLSLQIGISILLEQFIWCPFIYSVWDIPFPMLLRGDPIEDMPARVKATLPPLLWENCKVWTPANIIIYQIPLQWRVVLVSLTDVLWQSILSSALASSTALSSVSSLDETLVTKDIVSSLPQLNALKTNFRNDDLTTLEIVPPTRTVQP